MAVKVYLRLVAFRRRLHSSNDARLAGLVFSVVTGGPILTYSPELKLRSFLAQKTVRKSTFREEMSCDSSISPYSNILDKQAGMSESPITAKKTIVARIPFDDSELASEFYLKGRM